MISIFKKDGGDYNLKKSIAQARAIEEPCYKAVVAVSDLQSTRRALVEAILSTAVDGRNPAPLVHMIVRAVMCDHAIKSRSEKQGKTDAYALRDKIAVGPDGGLRSDILEAVEASLGGDNPADATRSSFGAG